ncbi:MAG: hypothetical protein ACRDMH_03265 [Solirubrobacterales bacterium]
MLEETGFRSIPFRTLDSWIRRGTHREEYRRLQEEMRDELNLRRSDDFESLSSAWNDLQWDVLRRLREKLPEAKVNELISAAKATPIASAISTDKARLYRNEATVIQKRPDAELEADIKRKLRELGFVYEGEAVEVKNEQLPEGGDGT